MNNTGSVLFCLQCGARLQYEDKFGRVRPVCPACGWIYFSDPKVAAAVVVMKDNHVLLTRRANPPFQGCWSLPAGFMDAGEDPSEAAKRECLEETGLDIKIGSLLNLYSGREHAHGADLVLIYEAQLIGGTLKAGDDADRAEFFPLISLPPLAFSATRKILEILCHKLNPSNE